MALKYDATGRPQYSAPWDAITDMPEIIDELSQLGDPGAGRWYIGWNDSTNEPEWVEIPDFAGAGTEGYVPDPVSETGRFLRDDGTWDNEAAFAGAGTEGLVPDPVMEVGRYLEDDGTWSLPPYPPVFSGTGDGDGLVPDGPGIEQGFYLRDDGTWAPPIGGTDGYIMGGAVSAAGTEINLPAGWTCSLTGTVYRVTHNRGLSDGNLNCVVATALQASGHASAQIDTLDPDYFEIVVFNDENSQITTSGFRFVWMDLTGVI